MLNQEDLNLLCSLMHGIANDTGVVFIREGPVSTNIVINKIGVGYFEIGSFTRSVYFWHDIIYVGCGTFNIYDPNMKDGLIEIIMRCKKFGMDVCYGCKFNRDYNAM